MSTLVIALVIGVPLALLAVFVTGVVIGATRLNHRREGRS